MDWNSRIRAELNAAGAPADEDVVEELAQHARALYEQTRADGGSHEDADERVAAEIARWRLDAASLRRNPRRAPVPEPPAASSSGLASLTQDVRYACRLLRRQPGFAVLVVLTMALGIGGTTALFSVTYGVLMKPLPWLDADRLVVLKETRGGYTPRFGSFSNAAYLSWRDEASTIEAIAGWVPQTVTLTGSGDPERLRVTAVSASMFRVLGIRPLIGSLFDDADDRAPVVVLSEGLWRQRFGGDPNVLGRIVHFDGEPRSVIGVVAGAFAYPDPQSRAWIPFRIAPATGNMLSMFEAVAKLRPGTTIEQAAAEGTARGRLVADTGMTTMAIFGGEGLVDVSVQPLGDAMTGEVRRPLIVLLVAVGLLLAIATSNVASLQLARATSRNREFAIRTALGASAARVLRQLLVEGLLLGIAGGAVGVGVAWLLLREAIGILPADFPRVHDLAIDARAAVFAVVTSAMASVIVGLLPAFHLRRTNLVASLAEEGTTAVGVSGRSRIARQRLLIIGGQVAIACVLLVGASLLARTFVELLRADRGYDPAVVATAPLPMAGPGYTPQRRTAMLRDIITRLGASPGIRHAAFTSEAPWMPGGSTSALTLPSRTADGSTVQVQASPRLVSPDYFAALGLRIVLGRSLQESDTATSQPVVVVNETFARRYLGAAPLEARIPMGVWGGAQEGFAAVVGVVEDVRYVRASVASLPEMYFSYRQLKVGMRSTTATLLIRGDGEMAPLATAVRSAVREVDAGLVPGAVMTIQDRLLLTSLARPRLYAFLLGGFAAAALMVTAVGLFGVLSYTVTQRTRELGVRAALGARQRDLVALVLRQGMGVCFAGAVSGLLVSRWATRFISTLLYGVSERDWLTYAAVPAVLLAVASLACLAPARRAARLDPLRALRS